MNVRIVYESSTTSNVVGLSVRHNNTRIHVRVRQEVGYRQHGGMIHSQNGWSCQNNIQRSQRDN